MRRGASSFGEGQLQLELNTFFFFPWAAMALQTLFFWEPLFKAMFRSQGTLIARKESLPYLVPLWVVGWTSRNAPGLAGSLVSSGLCRTNATELRIKSSGVLARRSLGSSASVYRVFVRTELKLSPAGLSI